MKKQPFALFGALGLIAVVLFALGLINGQVSKLTAQDAKVEICDNKLDDDGDKLVDCEDPDCKCEGRPGCSPGYWKNHTDAFNAWCASVPGWSCDALWTAITCRGSDSSCRRSEAAAALNAVSGCTE